MILSDLQRILSLIELAENDIMVIDNPMIHLDLFAAQDEIEKAIEKVKEMKVDEI